MKIKIKDIFKSKPKTTIGIILAITLFCVIVPSFSNASVIGEILGNAAADLLSKLTELIQGAISLLVQLGAAAMDGMLRIGFTRRGMDVAKTGWDTTRNFANMLFILFMVIIAFATILRIEGYGIKKLLPKVIIIALLINFSMVICYAIIDVSNVVATAFMNNIDKELNGKSFSNAFNSALQLKTMMLGVDYSNCDNPWKAELELCEKNRKNVEYKEYITCRQEADIMRNKCEAPIVQKAEESRGGWNSILNILISGTIGSIVLIVVAFVFFAGAIMLLIRMVVLWFLIMIAPLAYICHIFPSLSSNWKKWWSTFLNYCIFAPAYAFFIWLALKVANNNVANEIASGIKGASEFAYNQPSTNPFVLNPMQTILNYGFIIGLLIGGLIVAKQLGIAGANTAMKLATDAKKKATDWAVKKSTGAFLERGKQGLGYGKQGLGAFLQYVPGFKSTGRRMKVQGKLDRQKSAEDKKLADYDKQLELMNDKDRAKEFNMKHLRGSFRLHSAQAIANKDKHKADKETAQKVRNTLLAYGKQKEMEDFQNVRLDSIRDEKKRREETIKQVKKGKLNEISSKAAEDEIVNKAILETALPAQIDAWADTSMENAERLSKAFLMFADKSDDALFAFSAISGNLTKLGDKIKTFAEKWSPNAFKRASVAGFQSPDGDKTKDIPGVNDELAAKIANAIPTPKFRESVIKMEDKLAIKVVSEAYKNPDYQKVIDQDRHLKGILTKGTQSQSSQQSQQSQQQTQQTQAPPRPTRPAYRTVFENAQDEKEYNLSIEDWKRRDADWVSQYGRRV